MKLTFSYSIQQELDRVIDTVKSSNFFIKNGYRTNLPDGITYDNFDLSKAEKQVKKEFNEILAKDVEKEIRTKWAKHQKSIMTLAGCLPYEKPKSLKIILTQYGTGGSYYPPGTVIVSLRNYHNPVFTVIHEFLHLIIEEPVVRKYKLSHWQKESLVDYFINESQEINSVFPWESYQKSPPSKSLLKRIGWGNLDFEKVKPKKQNPLVKKFSKDVCDFFGIPELKINVYIMKSRAEYDYIARKKTETWMVGFARNKNVFILDKDKFETDSKHPKSDFELVLKHEISHIYYQKFSHNNTPTWLNEGTACFIAGQNKKPPKDIIGIKTLDKYHDKGGSGVYDIGRYMINQIVNDYGKEKLFELIKMNDRNTRYAELKKMFKWLK